MKAFLAAVVACVVIAVGAGFILTSFDPNASPSRTAKNVRLG